MTLTEAFLTHPYSASRFSHRDADGPENSFARFRPADGSRIWIELGRAAVASTGVALVFMITR